MYTYEIVNIITVIKNVNNATIFINTYRLTVYQAQLYKIDDNPVFTLTKIRKQGNRLNKISKLFLIKMSKNLSTLNYQKICYL